MAAKLKKLRLTKEAKKLQEDVTIIVHVYEPEVQTSYPAVRGGLQRCSPPPAQQPRHRQPRPRAQVHELTQTTFSDAKIGNMNVREVR